MSYDELTPEEYKKMKVLASNFYHFQRKDDGLDKVIDVIVGKPSVALAGLIEKGYVVVDEKTFNVKYDVGKEDIVETCLVRFTKIGVELANVINEFKQL
jgi:hypothetical protein